MSTTIEEKPTPTTTSGTKTSTTIDKQTALILTVTLCTGLALGLGLGFGLRQDKNTQSPTAVTTTTDNNNNNNNAGGIPDLHRYEWIDLTYTFHENSTLYWPTQPTTFEFETIYAGDTDKGYYYSAHQFCTPEHGGTHVDAPIHFFKDKHTTDQIPLERLNGPGIVIDISEQASQNVDYLLQVQDILDFEEHHGITIPKDAVVLLRTGQGDYYRTDPTKYFGDDPFMGDDSNLHFPSYGTDAVRFLIKQRSVSVLGIDCPSIDHGPSQDFAVHVLASEHNVPALENVANLDQVPASGSWIIALPMKISGGSGGPVRIVALVE